MFNDTPAQKERSAIRCQTRKEGNVFLFNDTLNTFYLQLDIW